MFGWSSDICVCSHRAVLEYDVDCVRPNTPPGSKLKLIGKTAICNGYLLLYKANCKLLGGHVQSMVESWNLKRVSVSALMKYFSLIGYVDLNQFIEQKD